MPIQVGKPQNTEISMLLLCMIMNSINGRIFYEKIYRRRKVYERGN